MIRAALSITLTAALGLYAGFIAEKAMGNAIHHEMQAEGGW